MHNDSLFDMSAVESLSPYGKWLKKHRIVTLHVPSSDDMDIPEDWEPWCACQGDGSTVSWVRQTSMNWVGVGRTEDEAIENLCKKMDINPYGWEEYARKGN